MRQDHRDLFRLAVQCCPTAMVMYDRAGTILLANPETERLFGYARDEMIGGSVETLAPDCLPPARRNGHGLPCGRHPVGIRKNGSTFPIEVRVSPAPARSGRLTIAVIADVSERRKNERIKDDFVSTVSHELRTPLTSIAGSLGLLTGGAGGAIAEPVLRLLKIAHKNSERLVRLINDLLDIEKIESGQVTFDLRRVDARALVEQAIEANRGYAEGFKAKVTLDPRSDTAFVRADPDRLMQVVTNLLSNACKFSPPDAEVAVSTAVASGNVLISVRDQGPGIPPDFRPRVFDKFAQADGIDTRQKGGTGLGLSIVKQIVVLHGGTIRFRDADGGGTEFIVELPYWDAVDGATADLANAPRSSQLTGH